MNGCHSKLVGFQTPVCPRISGVPTKNAESLAPMEMLIVQDYVGDQPWSLITVPQAVQMQEFLRSGYGKTSPRKKAVLQEGRVPWD